MLLLERLRDTRLVSSLQMEASSRLIWASVSLVFCTPSHLS